MVDFLITTTSVGYRRLVERLLDGTPALRPVTLDEIFFDRTWINVCLDDYFRPEWKHPYGLKTTSIYKAPFVTRQETTPIQPRAPNENLYTV